MELNLYYNFTIIKHFSVKSFGETEFWLSLIKVLTIIVFVIFGFLMIFGILGGHAYGFENYTKGQAPFVGGISGFLGVLLVAGFSVGGTEVVAVTAGESDDPKSLCLKQLNKCFGVYFYSMYYQLQSLVQLFRTQIHHY